MNKIKLKSLLMLLALGLTTASCTREEEGIDTTNLNESIFMSAANMVKLSDDITSDKTLSADKAYLLQGGVRVKAGATLTIPAGTEIYADASREVVASLIIEQGAKIDAEGTAAHPIIFTSNKEHPAAGDWGGLILVGKATINRPGGKATAEVEQLSYGGNDDVDNSGVLKYVRLEFTGAKISSEKEYNAFSFYSVGSGTTIDHLQAYIGNDDGFEFYGGTVNVKHLVSTGMADDNFDWTDGWRGKGQFLYARQSHREGDRGIEADNLNPDPTATPISHPTLSNVSLFGAATSSSGNYGADFRVGSQVTLVNSVIIGFSKPGIIVEGAESIAALEARKSTLSHNLIQATTPFSNGKDTSTVDLSDSQYHNVTSLPTGITLSEGHIRFDDQKTTKQAFNDLVVGGALDPQTLNKSGDSFFEAAAYIGAFDPAKREDWAHGWTKPLR